MVKIIKWFFISLLLLIVVGAIAYFLGPVGPEPSFISELPKLETTLTKVDSFVVENEKSAGQLKPDNEARIIWNDSIGKKTSYAIVYLHGFGASQGEGFPVHQNLADSLKANLYLSRLDRHGLVRKDAFKGITAESYMESAAKALAIGKLLGDTLIVIATSTGGSQALYLAAKFPNYIDALILYSPFIEMANPNLQKLSVGPWHEEITEAMIGSAISYTERVDSVAQYWSSYYHVDAYKALFSMVHYSTKPEILRNVKVPVFLAYYYKNEENQDDVVSVDAMKEMYDMLPTTNKEEIVFPETGNHVIASKWRSNDWQSVQDSTYMFLKKTFHSKKRG